MGWGILGGEDVECRSGGVTVRGHLGRPAAPGRFPAVISLHGRSGPSAGTNRAAERYGDAGYVGLAIDYFSRTNDPPDAEVMGYVADAAAFLRGQAYVDGDRIAICGYCGGGGRAYLALAHHPWLRAGVIFHGGLFLDKLTEQRPEHPFDVVDRIQVPLILLHGAADPAVKPEQVFRVVQRLEECGKTFEFKMYSGTRHMFVLPNGTDFNPAASGDAWDESIRFLDRHLRAATPAEVAASV
jgi:carboxymethylenebutenolidase